MKKLLSATFILIICVFSCLTLTGCTQKTYKLVGLVDVENDVVVYYEDLTDEKKEVIDYYTDFTIKLGFRDDITLNYKIKQKPAIIEYTIYGTYTLEDNVLSITYDVGNNNIYPEKHQYTNGRIIYYDSYTTSYLVFE